MAGHAHDKESPSPTRPDGRPGAVAAPGPTTMTVTGAATVYAVPDEAVITFVVESDGVEPGVSMSANAAEVEKVLARLSAEGVGGAETQTANVNVYPIRTYDPKTGQESLAGYRSQNTVVVRLRGSDMQAKAGRLLSAGLEAGATGVSGPAWRLRDETQVVAEALRQAAVNAKTKADSLAEAQGMRVGEVVAMREGIGDPAAGVGSRDVVYAKMATAGVPWSIVLNFGILKMRLSLPMRSDQ